MNAPAPSRSKKGRPLTTQPENEKNAEAAAQDAAAEAPQVAPHESGLRASRKARKAKKALPSNVACINQNQKKPAKKAPAKKAAAKKTTAERKPAAVKDKDNPWYTRSGYTPVPGQKLYEATGESGQIAVRSCATPMTHAVSWAHVDQPGERAKAVREGVIVHMYADELAAKKAAAKWQDDNPGDRLVVVEAREYQGQPGDKK
jgi:hypothetical protein